MKTYIGHCNNEQLRWQATSGGIGSAILKYLFETKQIGTAISFEFDSQRLVYIPRMIYSFDKYSPCGSIYNEIALVQFVRNNKDKIVGNFACFALPCQCKAIRKIILDEGKECFIIGLTCSSQQTNEATKYLLRRMSIKPNNVQLIRYRGNGWPSGIQVTLKNGLQRFMPNNNSLWTQIFHSRLFIMSRCFKCNETISSNADITLADPWGLEIANTDKIGHTLIFTFSEQGNLALCKLVENDRISLSPISEVDACSSQFQTIIRKRKYKAASKKIKILMHLIHSKIYRTIVLSNALCFSAHVKLKNYLEK